MVDDADLKGSKRLNKLMVNVLDFLGHVRLSEPCATLHHKLQARCTGTADDEETLNQCSSELEELLELVVATDTTHEPLTIEDLEGDTTPPVPVTHETAAGHSREVLGTWLRPRGSTGVIKDLSRQDSLVLFELLSMEIQDGSKCRAHRGRVVSPQDKVVFHDPLNLSSEETNTLVVLNLPLIYSPHRNGLEDMCDLQADVGTVIAGRYVVVKPVGSGSFSTYYECRDLRRRSKDMSIGLKVVKNNKDYVDSSLAELRILSLIQQNGGGSHNLLKLHGSFYWREHLILVTELQYDSLFKCYRSFERDEDRLRFFDQTMMAALSSQMLDALAFLHGLGVAHCDIKTENICLSATRPGNFTLIDFGSAVLTYDVHNSYIQSRWYRAPEVILGVPWDTKADLWSLGCVLAEIIVGQPLFRKPSIEAVLASHIASVGPIPSYMMQSSPKLSKMYVASGRAYQIDPLDMPPGAYWLQSLPNKQLPRLIIEASIPALFGDDLNGFIDHVQQMLTIDPQHRATALTATQHVWLQAQLNTPAPLAQSQA